MGGYEMSTKKGSANWFAMLREELAMIGPEDLIDPAGDSDADVDHGETILGVASMDIQKLMTYVEKMEEASTRTIVDARFTRDSRETQENLAIKSFEMATKADAARAIVGILLRDEFDLWVPNKSIGIRKGFVVVTKNRGER
jgi:hypothetical protein